MNHIRELRGIPVLQDTDFKAGILRLGGAPGFRIDFTPGLEHNAAGLPVGKSVLLGHADDRQQLRMIAKRFRRDNGPVILEPDHRGSGGKRIFGISQRSRTGRRQQGHQNHKQKFPQGGHRPFI